MPKHAHVAHSPPGPGDASSNPASRRRGSPRLSQPYGLGAAAAAVPKAVASDRATYLAVDIGGTTTRVGLVDSEGHISERWGEPTRRGTVVELASRIQGYADTMSQGRPEALAGIGLSLRGIIDGRANDYLGGTLFQTVKGVNVAHLLTAKLGLPVRMENDVNAAALAELRWGIEDKTFCYINVGTGIGAALIEQGRLLSGVTMRAGEIAELLVPRFAEGGLELRTLESLVSGESLPVLVREVFAKGGEVPPGTPGDAGLIVQLQRSYDGGSPAAEAVVDIVTGTLAHAIFNIESIVNCRTYVFGGGLFTEGQWLVGAVCNKLDAFASSGDTRWDGKLRLSSLPMEDIGLMGAAALMVANNCTERY